MNSDECVILRFNLQTQKEIKRCQLISISKRFFWVCYTLNVALWRKDQDALIKAACFPDSCVTSSEYEPRGWNSSRFSSGLSATHTFRWELPGQKYPTRTNFMCFASLLSGNRTSVGMVIFLFPWKPLEKAYKPASMQSWSEFHWESPRASGRVVLVRVWGSSSPAIFTVFVSSP